MELCPRCNEPVVPIDNTPDSSFCTNCGYVLEESSLSTEVAFGESSSGAAVLHGTLVGNTESRARSGAPGRRTTIGESHEQTLANGRRRITEIANSLKLSDHIREMAIRYFNLAVNNNFVKGRRSNYVVASCLYIACRMNKTNNMLIDFSETLQVNVFVLGNTFLRLVQSLSLSHKIPHVDPSLYIQRFAALLEFGPETPKVAADATALVTRFRDDWMVSGRRPAGICGACLLLAARMNNFRRSTTEIIQVVKIADVTIKKRLEEFKDTPAGQLSVEDFRAVAPSMTESADPPAFTRSISKEKEAEDNSNKKHNDVFAGEKRNESKDDVENGDGEADEDDDDVREEEEEALMETLKLDHIDQSLQDPELEKEVGDVLNSKVGVDLTAELDRKEEEARKRAQKQRQSAQQEEEANRLDNLDENSLDRLLMNDEEVLVKTHIWMSDNREFLEKVAAKRLKEETGEGEAKKKARRKKKQPRDSTNAAGETAADSAKTMLKKKKVSKKINYDVLSDLLNDSSSRKKSMSSIPESVWPTDQRHMENVKQGESSETDHRLHPLEEEAIVEENPGDAEPEVEENLDRIDEDEQDMVDRGEEDDRWARFRGNRSVEVGDEWEGEEYD